MNNKRPGLLPRVEVLLMIVFFLVFSFWAIRKCNTTRNEYRQQLEREQEEEAATAAAEKTSADSAGAAAAKTDPGPAALSPDRGTPLYVTIEELNMRAEPTLSSPVILQLKLYEEVYFMNEVTPFRDSINFGGEMMYEPWIKVRHRKGRVGWVYGPGVHYYKLKR